MPDTQFSFCWYQTFIFLLLLLSDVWICSGWFMFKFITTHDAELDLLLSGLEQKIDQHQPQQMRQSSLEQYFAPISWSDKIWFWLAKESLVVHQTRSDSLAESYQIIADRLLDFQLLHEIKFNVILCKTLEAGRWLLRGWCWSVFLCKIG